MSNGSRLMEYMQQGFSEQLPADLVAASGEGHGIWLNMGDVCLERKSTTDPSWYWRDIKAPEGMKEIVSNYNKCFNIFFNEL